VQVSAPRLAIARYVLNTDDHPTAEEVKAQVESFFPMVSLATVYNTLNLFVEKGLLKEVKDQESAVVRFDCNLEPHFHFIDEESGRFFDIPTEAIQLQTQSQMLEKDFKVSTVEVTLRGRVHGKKKNIKDSPQGKGKDPTND
jgi:Fe2+ or Zn2+ uptake regulation protein